MIRQHLVSFSLMDVCFELGLRVAGKAVNLEDDGEDLVNNLFNREEIKVDNIVRKLLKI